jgi:hypothetical protein
MNINHRATDSSLLSKKEEKLLGLLLLDSHVHMVRHQIYIQRASIQIDYTHAGAIFFIKSLYI